MAYGLRLVVLLGLLVVFVQDALNQGHSRDPSLAGKEIKDDPYQLDNSCVESLQKQINQELRASLVYLNMAAHFQQNSVAKKGFFQFFQDQSDEEKKHAHKLIHYVNLRGAQVKPFDVVMPANFVWASAKDAVAEAIALEKELNYELHVIHKTADSKCQDPHLVDFLENEYINEQVSSINALTKLKTTLESFGTGNEQLGEYHVDKQLLEESGRKYFEDEL